MTQALLKHLRACLSSARYLGLGLSCILLLAACASNQTRVEPAELERIKAQVHFNRLWARQVGAGVEDTQNSFTPALANNTLYANDSRGLVVAIEPATGKLRWKNSLKRALVGGIAAHDDRLWVSTRDGYLLALNADNGEIVWTHALTSEALAPVAANSQVVVVQTQDGHISCLARDSGEGIWVADTNVPVLSLRGTARPVIEADQVIAGFANGKVMSFDLKTGQVRWSRQVGQAQGAGELERLVDIDGNFLIDGAAVIASGYHGGVMAASIANGQPFWQQPTSSYRALAISSGSLYVSDSDSVLWRLDLRSGEPVWSQKAFLGRKISGPVILDKTVLVGDYDGYLHALEPRTGEQIGRFRVDDSAIRIQPLLDRLEDIIYVFSSDGKLVALSVKAIE